MTQAQLTERALVALKAWVHSMPIQKVRGWSDEDRALYAAAAELLAPRWRWQTLEPMGAGLFERTELDERLMATGRPEDIARLCDRLNESAEQNGVPLDVFAAFREGVRS